jgi:magnesium transporter
MSPSKRAPLFRRRSQRPGTPGGGTAVLGAATKGPTRTVILSSDGNSIEERTQVGLPSVEDVRHGTNAITWLHVQGMSDAEGLKKLGEDLGLHPLLVADLVTIGQWPKLEMLEPHMVLVMRLLRLDAEGGLNWEQVGLASSPGLVLSLQELPDDFLLLLRERMRVGRKTLRTTTSDHLALMLVSAVVDSYFPVLEAFADRLEELEEQILVKRRQDPVPALYRVLRELTQVRRAVLPLREALNTLHRDGDECLSEAVLPYLRDVTEHLDQVSQVTDSYRDLASTLILVHQSSVSNRINDVMRLLAVVTTVFTPLTFLAGVYGMNFDRRQAANMPELSWPYGYVFFWMISLITTTVLLLYFRRKGWLRRPPAESE